MPSIAGHEDSRGIAFENVYEGNPDDTDFAGNVSGCDIHRNDVGIHLLSGEIKIRGCDIYQNVLVGVYSSQTDLLSDIWPNLGGFQRHDPNNWGENNLYGNGYYALMNDSFAHPIYAIGNYWETNNPDSVIYQHQPGGIVHFEPFRKWEDGPYEHPGVPIDIIADTTWDEDKTIIGTVTVIPEKTLTIAPGVTVKFAAGNEAKLIVEGILDADGVTFTSDDTTNPTDKDWEGIVLVGDDSRIQNSEITDAEYAIVCDGADNIVIENCTISNCYSGIEVEYSNNITLRDNIVRTECRSAVYGEYCSNLTITGNELSSEQNSGINLNQCAEEIFVADNEAYNSWAGIKTSDSYTTLLGNELRNNIFGIYLNSSSCDVTSTLIEHNATGISVHGDSYLAIMGDGDVSSIGEKDKIQHNEGDGIHIYDEATMGIGDCYIGENLGHGIYYPNVHGFSVIFKSYVSGNGGNGIDISSGEFYLITCHVNLNRNYGIYASNNGSIRATRCRITGNHEDGIHLVDSNDYTSIGHSEIFHNGDDGIEVRNARVKVLSNGVFENSNRGIYVTADSVVNLGDLQTPRENDLFDNGSWALYNETSDELSAVGNYWGTDTPENVIWGLVDYADYSVEPFRDYGGSTSSLPPGAAERIMVGETLLGQLFEWDSSYSSRSDGDYCQYRCQLHEGKTYTIITTNAQLGNTLDTYLYLLDDNGLTVEEDDDGNGNRLSKIEYTPSYSGTFYIRLRAYSKGRYGYCDLTLIESAEGDSGAPMSPSISGPTMITVNSPVTYYASSSDVEEDLIQFEWSSWEGAYIDPIWYSSEASAGIILIAPPSPGTYIISCRARDYPGNISPWVGLAITVQSGNDSYGISVGETLTNQLFEWQSDYTLRGDGTYCQYSCQLDAGITYVITTDNAAGGTTDDTYLFLLNGSYSVITSNDDGNGNFLSKIEYTPSYSGIFYIRLRAYNQGTYGYCDLSLDVGSGMLDSISVGETLTD